MQPTTQKKIKIISMDSKEMNGANGPWTKYTIKAHDGQYYGSTDALWFSKRKIGEVLVITYWSTVPAANKFGKMVSYNNVVTDNQNQGSIGTGVIDTKPINVSQVETRIYAALATMEANIIEAIKTHCGTDLKTISQDDLLDEKPTETLSDSLDENLETTPAEENLDNPF